jgi:hypothetical protein
LSQAFTSPLRPTYSACGANWWISGISGAFGPLGSDAVVITGIFMRAASFASMIVLLRNSTMPMSFTVWNNPVW